MASPKESIGTLPVRSKSGLKRGRKKGQIKCKLKKYDRKRRSRIPVFTKLYQRTNICFPDVKYEQRHHLGSGDFTETSSEESHKLSSFIVMPMLVPVEKKIGDFEEEEDTETSSGYIDSGLRRLTSQNSRLRIDFYKYKDRKESPPTSSDEDGVQPLLKTIPSEIFRKAKKAKKAKDKQQIPVTPKSEVSEEEKSSSPPSTPEPVPIADLKDFEDITYTIDIKDVEPIKIEEDFCIHSKDFPDDQMSQFSDKSFWDFLKKKDFCVHVEDFDGSFSTEGFKNLKTEENASNVQFTIERRERKVLTAAAPGTKLGFFQKLFGKKKKQKSLYQQVNVDVLRSLSQSIHSKSMSGYSSSGRQSNLLPSNKERRRWSKENAKKRSRNSVDLILSSQSLGKF